MADSRRNPFRGAILADHQADGVQARICAARARSRRYSGTSLGARFCEVAYVYGREKGLTINAPKSTRFTFTVNLT
jgi:hypothetical protein